MSTQTQTATTHGANAHAKHEHGGTALYTKILIALLILTAITVFAAGFDFGQGNVVIALVIATIKASLVGLFFMHLVWDKPVNAVIAMAGFLFLGIFIMFCLLDFNTRNNFIPQNMTPTLVPLAPGTAPAGNVIRTNPAAGQAEGGEKK
ncbi:MAG: cytochrome C oxidase subunit IV family protein [Bryobacterales bacterium]|nr:cytochrome C oxidase subunit IV family protein [Bryobacterales bacterium]MBV9400188.1 cytochrome C oxidase subunit IV family protein [Bryobacterales bacterium]